MDFKAPNLALDLSKNMDPNYDLTKLLLNKINSLSKQPNRPKSRSSSINEIPYSPKSRSGSINEIPKSPTKCFNELNFYKTTKEFDNIENHSDDETCNQDQNPPKFNRQKPQSASDNNQISKFLQIKQINDLLLLNNPLCNQIPINFQEQFESDSVYSSSVELNGWALDNRQFVLQCLNRHNYLRKLHQVPSLNLSKNLNIYSQDWVEILARNDRLEKRFSNRYGENVFVMQLDEESTSLNGAIPVDHWYCKGVNYDYNGQYPNTATILSWFYWNLIKLDYAHAQHHVKLIHFEQTTENEFTQLIWKNTKYLGVALSRSKSNKIYVVASYSQAGNWPNQMKQNVFPIAKE